MDSLTLTTSHLQSPIFYLATEHCRRRQQSTTSIFNLRSHIWGGWLGARIYNLHSPSPVSTFWPVLLLSDLQSTISIFDLSLEWGTGQEGSTGETWACPCERSARISSLNLLSLPPRSTVLAQRFPLLRPRAL